MNRPIFGSDGSYIYQGGHSIYSQDGMYQRAGNNIFGNDKSLIKTGGMSFVNGRESSGVIFKTGSNYTTSKGIYRLVGSTLYSPSGKMWFNVSESDVEAIILTDL